MAEFLTDIEKEEIKVRVKVANDGLKRNFAPVKQFCGFINSMLAISACVAGFYVVKDIMQNKTTETAPKAGAALGMGAIAYAGHKRAKNGFLFQETEEMRDILEPYMSEGDKEFLNLIDTAKDDVSSNGHGINVGALSVTWGCWAADKLTDAQALLMSLACMGTVGITTELNTAGKLKIKKEFLDSRLSQICNQRAH